MRKLTLALSAFGLLILVWVVFFQNRRPRPELPHAQTDRLIAEKILNGSNAQSVVAASIANPSAANQSVVDANRMIKRQRANISGTGENLNPNVLKQLTALETAKMMRTPAQQKMSSQLIDAEKMRRGELVADGIASLRVDLDTDAEARVLTDIDAKVSERLLQQIELVGGKTVNHFEQFNAIRAWLPLAQVETLANREDVKFIRPAVKAVTNTGSVTSEGDVTHGADAARARFGVTGAGVKVGVISDSVDHLAESQASADLGPVTTLEGRSGVPGTGEGTAMLEVVHDLAPGAELFFATGLGGAAAFAQNIRDLRFQSGCDIIIDDVTYADESPFQDGVIAQAVNAVTADGALLFSSAANSGNKDDNTSGTWEGDYVDGGDFSINGKSQGRVHTYGTTPQNTATKGGRVNLFWADPLGAAGDDYDVYVVNAAGTSIVAEGNTTQNGTQDPYEFVSKANDGERILIVKFSGAARFLHLETTRGRLAISTSGSTRGHNAAKDAFTVAAVNAKTSFPNPFTGNTRNPVETFSSDGPRRVFFYSDGTPITPGNFSATGGTVWQKPDIAAADGVLTTLPADSGLNPFFGTSAAAPHAGAVAALVKAANPALSPAQVRSILTSTALDIEGAGLDQDSGAGIVMALAALQAVPGPDLPTINGFNPSSGGVGAEVILTGTKFNGASAVRFNGVAATFTVDSATQISTTVPVGATTGRIAVTLPAGTATSATDFTVLLTPAITGFQPASGAVGATVIISGANLNGATAVKFNNLDAPGFIVNSTVQVTATVPAGATTGRIIITTPAGTATSPDVFNVTALPSISSFSPNAGGVGTSVIINGANFTGATALRFNGVSAITFTVDSAIRMTATVPAGATTGPISVTTPNGTASSAAIFTVVPAPSIAGFSPLSGVPGANVTITGANLSGATAVRFSGVSASFSVTTPGQVSATVPTGATSGNLSVTTPGGTSTSATAFTIPAPPANDNFANAQTITGVSGTASGDNTAATREVNEPNHAGDLGGKSVWYVWTAPSAGAWRFTTLGSSFDTVLAVYTGSSLAALTPIAAGTDMVGGTNSDLSFVALAGTQYRIAVDGFRSPGGTAASAASGNVVLNWTASTAPTISSFSPSRGTPGSSVTIKGANFTGATAVRFGGVSSSFNVDSAVQITATVPANATTGLIEVVSPAGSTLSSANFTLFNPPNNDPFAAALLITGSSGTVSGRNTDASKEVNEPNHAGNPGGKSIWYAWTAPGDGPWTFDTQGSSFDTLLGIYTGNNVGALSLVASNDDSSPGTSSRVTFAATAGTTYRIAIDGRNGDSGTVTLNWAFTPNPPSITSFAPARGAIGSTVVLTGINLTGATGVRLNGVLVPTFSVDSATQITLTVPLGANTGPFSVTTPNGTAVSAESFVISSGPPNDQFANARELSGSATVVTGQNVTATKETGEPPHAGDPGGRSVWYRWIAPDSGTWAVDTAGSSFDTTLAVYTGSAVNALSEIASNDDARADRSSRVTFTAAVGTTYWIAVDGFGGDSGNFTLKLLPTVASQVVYETGFEATDGFSTTLPLVGQNGWKKFGSGGNGIMDGVFPGRGQQAYVGLTPSPDSLFVYHALDFVPETNSRPVAQFSVLMGIMDSSNFAYDSFDWQAYNRSGKWLFSLDFDNSDLGIYYQLNDETGYYFTGQSFENGPIYALEITMDFARNRWRATLDGQSLGPELPITTTDATLDLGEVDAAYLPNDSSFAGDNAMFFDNYRVTAEPSEVPKIVLGPQNQAVTAGSPASFTVVASGGEPLQYQWLFNNVPILGQTNAVLDLSKVDLGQVGPYSVVVSNASGSVSGSATLTVSQPGPLTLAAGARLPDGRFQLTLNGTAGSRVAVEFSDDLVSWQNLTTVVLSGAAIELSDPDTRTEPWRYYRARLQP